MNFITKYLINRELNKKQEELSCKYKKDGLTEKVLEDQVTINNFRNMFDIPDNSEKIYKKFVQ